MRVLANPAYFGGTTSVADIAARLRRFCESGDHEFWPDDVSLRDAHLFNQGLLGGHRQVTDVYLLGLAVRHRGCLVTFDRSIPLKAVVGATPGSIAVVGGAEHV